MIFSKRTTETIWLTSSLGFCIGVTSAGWVGYIFAALWAAFIVHCSQCLYRVGREDGQREGYQAGREDMVKEIQSEANRQLQEAMDKEAALWRAVGESIQESLRHQTMVVRNPNYHEKN